MKWESGSGLDQRLVADDGEILDWVEFDHYRSGYKVRSTGKVYVDMAQAQRAAESAHQRWPQEEP